jgi:hypothetical protein
MKKGCFFVLVVFFICVLNACTSLGSLNYPAPTFEKPSANVANSVYVFDSFKSKPRVKDFIKLHNFSSESHINFYIYVHHPGTLEWLLCGIGTLSDPGDTDTVESLVGDLKNFRYFAIEPKDGNSYQYQFYVRNNDLHINILDI